MATDCLTHQRDRNMKYWICQENLRFIVAWVVFVFFFGGNAVVYAVEIGCAGSNRNPAACSFEECTARYAAQSAVCNTGNSCRGVFGCENLQAKKAANEQCIAKRNDVQGCYFLPDPGHEIQVAGLRDAIARCDRKISLPEPEGCGDPCP